MGVEEHVVFQELTDRLLEDAVIERGYLSRNKPYGHRTRPTRWPLQWGDTEDRLKQLDAAGLTVQVLSYPMTGADLLPHAGLAVGERKQTTNCRPLLIPAVTRGLLTFIQPTGCFGGQPAGSC